MEEAVIEVPSHFLCPISLQLMRDPVTISTGITYDRGSIERWLFSGRNHFCLVTKQAIFDSDLNPNHTLRRLIQSWCSLNATNGVERIPTPKLLLDRAQIMKILADALKAPNTKLQCMGKLRSIASESERNKAQLVVAGALEFLASAMKNEEDKTVELGPPGFSGRGWSSSVPDFLDRRPKRGLSPFWFVVWFCPPLEI